MPLLLDTDVFLKLGATGLLRRAVGVIGYGLPESRRLPALPHMLSRGKLRKSLGDRRAEEMLELATQIEEASPPPARWLDLLVGRAEVDPGEAHLLSVAASSGALVMTGDKRALSVVSLIPAFVPALQGRVVLLEAVMYELCATLGTDLVQVAVRGANLSDQMLDVCFGTDETDAWEALESYLADAERRLRPLSLWSPPSRRGG